MKKYPLLSLGVLATIFAAQSVQSATIVAVDDNYVLNSASSTVQNADGNLVVKNASNNIRKSWLKFDLSGTSADLSQSGTVTLTLAATTSSDTTFRLALYALDDTGAIAPTWLESTITWSNAPGNDTSGGGIRGLEADETTLLGETANIPKSTAAGTQYQFTIPTLSTYLQSDDTITVIAISSNQPDPGPSFNFASSENATEAWRPTLEFATIPEPSAAALIGVAGFMAVALRSRSRR